MIKRGLFLLLFVVMLTGAVKEIPARSPDIPDSLPLEFKVSPDWNPPAHSYRPQVAFNYVNNEYLVVWHSTWDDGTRYVYARRLDRNGKPIGKAFSLTTLINVDVVHPYVVYNHINNEYLVVWMQDVYGDNVRYEIWGSIIPWNASGPGKIFAIGDWFPFTVWYPSVAWNSLHNEYLVIWDTYLMGNPPDTPMGIGYRRVTANGVALSYPDWLVEFHSPKHSDLVFNPANEEYLVVWEQSESGSEGIYGSRLTRDISCDYCEFPIYTGMMEKPSVATNQQNRYLVGWGVPSGAPWVKVQMLDAAGHLLDTEFLIANWYENVDVAASGANGDWGVAYESSLVDDKHIYFYHLNWMQFSPSFPIIRHYDFHENNRITRNAAIIGGDSGFLIVYEGRSLDPGSRQHIFARKLEYHSIFLPFLRR